MHPEPSLALCLMPPQNILFVLDHFYPHVGGAETLFWELSTALAREGHQVTVVTRRERGTLADEEVHGIRIRRVWTPRWAARIWFMILAIPIVWRLSKRATLVHAAVYGAAFPAWIVARLRRRPAVLTVYEVFGRQWQQLADIGLIAGHIFRIYERWILGLRFSRSIAISEFTKQRLLDATRLKSSDVDVVYPAVDYDFWDPRRHQARPLRAELGFDDDAPVYLFFGRPGVSKGVEDLLLAARHVHQHVPNARLVLLLARQPADGHARAVRKIGELALETCTTLLEPVARDDLPSYLLAADLVVVPSISEGFGYSAVEAATIGCRVLATSGHATEEVLGGAIDYSPPSDPLALGQRIVELLGATPAAKAPLERTFTVESHISATKAIYEQIISRK